MKYLLVALVLSVSFSANAWQVSESCSFVEEYYVNDKGLNAKWVYHPTLGFYTYIYNKGSTEMQGCKYDGEAPIKMNGSNVQMEVFKCTGGMYFTTKTAKGSQYILNELLDKTIINVGSEPGGINTIGFKKALTNAFNCMGI